MLNARVVVQFYLGTTRLQLEHKGDANHVFTNLANIVPAFGFVGIPVIGWLLDNKGYGITLGTINCMGVLASIFQAVPNLGFQVRHPLLMSTFFWKALSYAWRVQTHLWPPVNAEGNHLCIVSYACTVRCLGAQEWEDTDGGRKRDY